MTATQPRPHWRALLQTLQPGLDPIPTQCPGCQSRLLSMVPAMDGERFGALTCSICSRELAWLLPPLPPLPSTAAPLRRAEGSASATPSGTTTTFTQREPAWRLPSCSRFCCIERVFIVSGSAGSVHRIEWRAHHDIVSHEAAAMGIAIVLAAMMDRTDQAERLALLGPPRVAAGPLMIDREARRAYIDGVEARLTDTEYALIHALSSRTGHVWDALSLTEAVWPGGFSRVSPNVPLRGDRVRILRTNMQRLRDKLGPARSRIETFFSRGYVLHATPLEPS